MTPEEKLYEVLSGIGSVYPMQAPQNTKVPFIIYHMTADTINTYIDGSNSYDESKEKRFMVNVYQNGYQEFKQLVEQCLVALKTINGDDFQIVIYGTVDSVEDGTYRSKIDLKIYHRI